MTEIASAAAPTATHPTVFAQRWRTRGVSTRTIAQRLAVSINVVARWFDLIDELELSTIGEPLRAEADISYKDVSP